MHAKVRPLLGCIECTRRRLLQLMFVQSVCHAASRDFIWKNSWINRGLACGGDCWNLSNIVLGGRPNSPVYSMQPSPNCFGHFFLLVTGDNGTMHFWDWKSGYNFQRLQSAVQPGSIDSESGIFASTFDKSSCRLITCEADKTIKIYKEDETAVRSNITVLRN